MIIINIRNIRLHYITRFQSRGTGLRRLRERRQPFLLCCREGKPGPWPCAARVGVGAANAGARTREVGYGRE
jgi:hypothetical protein